MADSTHDSHIIHIIYIYIYKMAWLKYYTYKIYIYIYKSKRNGRQTCGGQNPCSACMHWHVCALHAHTASSFHTLRLNKIPASIKTPGDRNQTSSEVGEPCIAPKLSLGNSGVAFDMATGWNHEHWQNTKLEPPLLHWMITIIKSKLYELLQIKSEHIQHWSWHLGVWMWHRRLGLTE